MIGWMWRSRIAAPRIAYLKGGCHQFELIAARKPEIRARPLDIRATLRVEEDRIIRQQYPRADDRK